MKFRWMIRNLLRSIHASEFVCKQSANSVFCHVCCVLHWDASIVINQKQWNGHPLVFWILFTFSFQLIIFIIFYLVLHKRTRTRSRVDTCIPISKNHRPQTHSINYVELRTVRQSFYDLCKMIITNYVRHKR